MDGAQITYRLSPEKNKQLIAERQISFEDVIAALDNNQLLEVVNHPNQQKYPNQQIFVVQIKDYVYLVPFVVEKHDSIFLKTVFASRKAKKKHSTEGNKND